MPISTAGTSTRPAWSSSSSVIVCLMTLLCTTLPIPAGVETRLPSLGSLPRISRYTGYSKVRQQSRRPQTPEILSGLSASDCSFAMRMPTLGKSVIQLEQQRRKPQMSWPSTSLARSRGPTWCMCRRTSNSFSTPIRTEVKSTCRSA